MAVGKTEIILGQLIMYSVIFLLNPYIGFMLCLIISVIALGILIVSIGAEIVQRSKVPKGYFHFMLSAILCPIAVIILFTIFDPGAFDWMNE